MVEFRSAAAQTTTSPTEVQKDLCVYSIVSNAMAERALCAKQ